MQKLHKQTACQQKLGTDTNARTFAHKYTILTAIFWRR